MITLKINSTIWIFYEYLTSDNILPSKEKINKANLKNKQKQLKKTSQNN